jgi:tetratricopeptide (TPR) repeat protein
MVYVYKPGKGFVYKEEGMKKAALVMVLFLLFVSIAGATNAMDDKEFRTGLKYYNSKNYKEAVKYFKEYASRKPDPTAYYLIGYSLYKQKKFDEADEYFKQAYFIDPEFSLEKVGLIKRKQPAR